MRRIGITLFLVAALAACQDNAAEPPGPDATADAATDATVPPAVSEAPGTGETSAVGQAEPEADECGAGKLGRWLNVLPSDTVKVEISDAVGHDLIRYIAPGDAVTMDLRLERLNVETGEDGRIERFFCG